MANEQVEIEDYFLPKRRGESNCERIKRVLHRVLKRPRLSENVSLKLERFKIWAKRNLFGLIGIAIVLASAITAVLLVTRRA